MVPRSLLKDIVRDKRTQLPTLSVVAGNIITLAGNEKTSAAELAEFIQKDQAIANKVLKLANSAYYGLVRTVDSIPHAISVIGFQDVTGLAIGMSVFSAFDLKRVGDLLPMDALWLHSLACATAARELAGLLALANREQLFLNGLLHDMGKVLLAIYFPDEYGIALAESQKDSHPLHSRETEIFSLDHAGLAGQLMRHWRFPDRLVYPVEFHHCPAQCPPEFKKQALLVEVADYLCHQTAIGGSGNPGLAEVQLAVKNLGLTRNDLARTVAVLESQRANMTEYLEVLH